jgi:hypothetical protein
LKFQRFQGIAMTNLPTLRETQELILTTFKDNMWNHRALWVAEIVWAAMEFEALADGGEINKARLYRLINLDNLAHFAEQNPNTVAAQKIQAYLENLPGWAGQSKHRSTALQQHFYQSQNILLALYPDEKITPSSFGLV